MQKSVKEHIKEFEAQYKYPDICLAIMDFNREVAWKRIKSLGMDEQQVLNQVPVLMLPTRDINALAACFSGDSYVVINFGLPVFIEVFSNLFFDDLLLMSPNTEKINEEKAQVLVEAIAFLLGDYSKTEELSVELKKRIAEIAKIAKKRKKRVTKNREELLFFFQASILGWFIGHEYGHIFHGHFDGPRKSIMLSNSTKTLEAIEHDHNQEYEADKYGLKFMSQEIDSTYKKQGIIEIFNLSSADISTSIIRLIEYSVQVTDHWTKRHFEEGFGPNFANFASNYMIECRLTHPRARLRNERIRELSAVSINNSVLAMANNVQLIIESTLNMIHQNKVSSEPLRAVVLSNIDEIPDDIMARAYEMD